MRGGGMRVSPPRRSGFTRCLDNLTVIARATARSNLYAKTHTPYTTNYLNALTMWFATYTPSISIINYEL